MYNIFRLLYSLLIDAERDAQREVKDIDIKNCLLILL